MGGGRRGHLGPPNPFGTAPLPSVPLPEAEKVKNVGLEEAREKRGDGWRGGGLQTLLWVLCPLPPNPGGLGVSLCPPPIYTVSLNSPTSTSRVRSGREMGNWKGSYGVPQSQILGLVGGGAVTCGIFIIREPWEDEIEVRRGV